jgi:hypothetical protein
MHTHRTYRQVALLAAAFQRQLRLRLVSLRGAGASRGSSPRLSSQQGAAAGGTAGVIGMQPG